MGRHLLPRSFTLSLPYTTTSPSCSRYRLLPASLQGGRVHLPPDGLRGSGFAVAYTWFMFYGMDMSYDNMYNKFYGTARVTSLLHLSTFFLKSMIQHRRALDTS